jgi:hypothetical protein
MSPSGEQPEANQHQEVVTEGNQGPHRPRKAVGDRHRREVGLGQVVFALRRAWSTTAVSRAWRVGK